ncbi:MAG: leucine-rich repeat protein [Clostridium sp.]|nr:leucine-rich repeat protein [Clostridium sp.]MCM1460783.1 leucine-rich repeat protein [Bacteroides sp.]
MNVKKFFNQKDVNKITRRLKRAISLVLTAVMLVTLAPQTMLFDVQNVKAAAAYNPQAAANYALQYTDESGGSDTSSYNKEYSYFSGNDCANFVSQCLVAGGLQTDSNWYKYSQSWKRADYLYEWFKSKDEYKNLIVKNPSASQVKIGDPIFYVWGTEDLSKTNPNDIDHAGICTGYDSNGNPLVSAHSNNRKNYSSWKMGAGAVYVVRLDQLNTNKEPIGCFDEVESQGAQKIRIKGWAYDPDEPSKSIDVHVYIGSVAGEPNAEVIAIPTNICRTDVNKIHGISGNHGFDVTITVNKNGNQPINIYAIDSALGNNPQIGTKNVTIVADTETPNVTDAKIFNVTSDGYDVSFKVSDNVGVTRVECPTWTAKDGQDDIVWYKATVKDGVATCHVNRAEHNNEYGIYISHAYAWDAQGNKQYASLSVTLTDETVSSHTHTWTKKVVSQPTCDKTGSNLYTCKECGSTYSESVEAIGHRYANYISNNNATCINDGTATATCTTCGKLNTVILKNSATGVHIWDKGTIIKNPTTTENGSKLYVCSVCGETKTEVLPVKISVDIPEEPTPQKPTVTVPKVGDTFKDTKSRAQYKITGKQTVSFIKTTATSGKVTIPATVTYKGKTFKVTAIYKGAFKNKTGITAVTFGKNITSVGSEAFSGCKKLKTVTLNVNLTKMDERAFYKCTALTTITIPKNVKQIGKQAFYGCKKLKSITIKTTKLKNASVGSNAFKGIYSKATIKVPKSKKAAYKKLIKSKGAGKNVKYK